VKSRRQPPPPAERSLDLAWDVVDQNDLWRDFTFRQSTWQSVRERMDAKMTARLIPEGTRVFVLGLGWGVALEAWGQLGTPIAEPAQMVQLDGMIGQVPVLVSTMLPATAVAGRDPASLSPFGGAA